MDGATLEPAHRDPLEGTILAGRYAIEVCVGEGAMGRVYRARHRHLERNFAVKVLFGEIAADASMRRRFAREAEVASRLDHPHVVPSVDFGELEGGLLYLAMPYVAGVDLATLVRREGPLAPRRAVRIARQVAAGLGHAHACGLIHRDLKPTNILVEPTTAGEHARILDFGLALGSDEGSRSRLTTAGIVMGTPLYMAPEQACGGDMDERADLFSLGVTLYEMLAGVPPFEGTPTAVARKHAAASAPPISERVPGLLVPPALEAIVFRLMEKAPDDRYPTADAVVHALGAIRADALRARTDTPMPALRESDLDAVATLDLRADKRPQRRSMTALASLGAVATLGVAVLAVQATPRASSEVEDAPAERGQQAAASPEPGLAADPERGDESGELAELTRRYRELSAALDRLERRGERDAAAMRERFFAIPYAEAIRKPSARKGALAALAELAEEVEAMRERDDGPVSSLPPPDGASAR